MIAADTSTWIAFLEGEAAHDTELLDEALRNKQVVMVPVVLTELLSDPKLPLKVTNTLTAVPLVEVRDRFWIRAGLLRAQVLANGRKARLGDALIAQFCVDHQIALVTRDRDFRAFAEAARLTIVLA